MHFTNVMLLYTTPLYWTQDPLHYAESLRDFLLFLIDPRKDGYGALGVPIEREQQTLQWYAPEKALAWINEAFTNAWRPWGERLREDRGNRENRENALRGLEDYQCSLFLDKKRLDACLKEQPGEPVPEGTYISLLVKWFLSDESLLWMPQLRISNFWPKSRLLAPDQPNSCRPAIKVMGPKEAADILEDIYWIEVETRFRRLRYSYGLGQASIMGGVFGPPVFYYASPARECMPTKPEEYLYSDRILPLEMLCRRTLGTQDPLSADVSGALLEGNLLFLRRERRAQNALVAFYLIVPWFREEGDWEAEVEREVCYAAHHLTASDVFLAAKVYDLETELEIPSTYMSLWGGTLDGAVRLVKTLRRVVAFEPQSRRYRKEAFRMVGEVRLALSKIETDMLRTTEEIAGLEARWRVIDETFMTSVRDHLAERAIQPLAPLLRGLGARSIYSLSAARVERAVQRARGLRQHFGSITTALMAMLELEGREEREQQERNQRTLNHAVATLTVVMAFPIVVGQLDWNDLKNASQYWPEAIKLHGEAVEAIHGHIVLGVVGMALLIACFFLVYAQKQLFLTLREKLTGGENVKLAGRSIARVWSMAEQAAHRHTPLAQIEWLDTKACEALCEVWDDGLEMAGKNRKQALFKGIDELREEVDYFILTTEVFDNRPMPLWLPRLLCIFRYQSSPKFVSEGVVPDLEFRAVLERFGFEPDEQDNIDAWARRLYGLPAKEFISAMHEKGVSALHQKRVDPPV